MLIPEGHVYQFAPLARAYYWSVALKGGVPLDRLRDTGQSDYFISYLSRPLKDQIPPRAGLRLNCDIIEFRCERLPRWVPVSIPGYNAAESGFNAYQELAVVLANAILISRRCYAEAGSASTISRPTSVV